MRRRLAGLCLAVALLGLTGGATAQTAAGLCPGLGRTVTPYAFETLTASTTAGKFTHATYAPAGSTPVLAIATIESQSIRYRDDGTAPTASVGHQADAGAVLVVCGPAIGNFSYIRKDSADATLRVTYYR